MILLIDDNVDFLNSVKGFCKRLELKTDILCFEDAFEAMNFISNNFKKISGVFTDYKMSKFGMNGDIIVQKCIESMIPVYVCTGYETSDIKVKCEVIPKMEIERLVKTMATLSSGNY